MYLELPPMSGQWIRGSAFPGRGHEGASIYSEPQSGVGRALLPVNTGPIWAWWDLFFSWPCFSKASCPFTCSTFQVLLKMFTAFIFLFFIFSMFSFFFLIFYFFLILKSLILTCVPKHEPPSHLFTAFNKTNKSGGTNVSHYPTTPPASFPSPSLLGHFSAGLAWSPGIRDRGKKWIGKDTG